MSEEPVVIVFVPALAPLLVRAEQLKGAPLTEAEVVRIRDEAICVTMTQSQARALAENRGYDDLDPENCWSQWLVLREEIARPE